MLGRWWGIIWLWFASAGTEKERPLWDCEGQTGLISLQQPLKFLPCDINEVIHRKAAAHQATPPPLLPPHSSSHFNNLLQHPLSESLRLYLGRGTLCQGRSPYKPQRAWQLPIDGPRAGRGWAEGWGVQLCMCRHARRGWQQSGSVSYINRKILFP